MHGFYYTLAAMAAFVVGGVLNLVFLPYVLIKKDAYFSFSEIRKKKIAQGGLITSAATVIFQLLFWVFVW